MAFGDRLRKNKWLRAAVGIATGGASEVALGTQSAIKGTKDPWGRAIAGIGTLGASEAVGGVARKVGQNAAERKNAWSDLMDDKTPTLAMPADRTTGYYDRATNAAAAPTKEATFARPKDASGYISGIDAAMGIKAPIDTRAAVRTATMGELDRSAHEQDIAQAHRVANQGAGGSALELSLKNRTGQQLAANRANAEANIQQDFANAQSDYDKQRRAAAINAGIDMTGVSQFNAGQGNAQNQFRAGLYSDIGQQVGKSDLDRATLDYEANQLFPFQVSQANKMAYLNKLEQDKANRTKWAMEGIDTATKIGTSFLGGA